MQCYRVSCYHASGVPISGVRGPKPRSPDGRRCRLPRCHLCLRLVHLRIAQDRRRVMIVRDDDVQKTRKVFRGGGQGKFAMMMRIPKNQPGDNSRTWIYYYWKLLLAI